MHRLRNREIDCTPIGADCKRRLGHIDRIEIYKYGKDSAKVTARCLGCCEIVKASVFNTESYTIYPPKYSRAYSYAVWFALRDKGLEGLLTSKR